MTKFMSDWSPTTVISIYAAIISTVAISIQVRNYFASGVRLHLSLIPNGVTIGAGPESDEDGLIILTVTNRGTAPTMITRMVVLEFTSSWQRLRLRPKQSAIIPNPQLKGYPPNTPSELAPAKNWTGVIRTKRPDVPNFTTGNWYAGVYVSTRNQPYLKRIPKRAARNSAR
ncbi:MAG: hypothetical protein WCF20_00820 [Methylovirgula sp.]